MSTKETREKHQFKTVEAVVKTLPRLGTLFLLSRAMFSAIKFFQHRRKEQRGVQETENEKLVAQEIERILATGTEKIKLEFQEIAIWSSKPSKGQSLTPPDISFPYGGSTIFIEVGENYNPQNDSKKKQRTLIRYGLEAPGEKPGPFLYVQLYFSDIEKLKNIQTIPALFEFLEKTRHCIKYP